MTEPIGVTLPVDPVTKQPLAAREQPGYYPGYHTLDQRRAWDNATRSLIENRVYMPPPIRFFSPNEAILMTAICGRVLPQDDRVPARRIPIVNFIDERLWENKIDGYRYEDMPEDREAHRLGMQAIDLTAKHLYGEHFVVLNSSRQELVLKSIHDGQQIAAHDIWSRMPIERYWHLLVQDCAAAYYAHPWAWDEIGFGGPAYPRAYTRLENGLPEPWEVDEQRYRWEAPPGSLSDLPGGEPEKF
jgi:hypothetical protein